MFLEAQARAALQQEEAAEELFLDTPPCTQGCFREGDSEPLLREATAEEQAMFLEAQARAAVQQEEEAEELLLDPPQQDSAAQCPRAPRQLCVDCDPPKAVAQTHCEECSKALCGNCTTTCTRRVGSGRDRKVNGF